MGKNKDYFKPFSGFFTDFPFPKWDFTKKEQCITSHITYMLSRTNSMFRYEGLPDTIPQEVLETYLQVNGSCVIFPVDRKLYAFVGGAGGEPDVYYRPTQYTVANPALNLSKVLTINKDCVLFKNDIFATGLIPLFSRYATAITENEISMKNAIINTRVTSLLTAPDDKTRASAEVFLKRLEDGELSIIGENGFFDGIRTLPYTATAGTNFLTQLIENEQYLKASWFNELGLNANYNMKRESLNSAESQLNNDALLPLVDTMRKCRENAVSLLNSMYDLSVSVHLSSSWEDNEQEIEIEHKKEGEPDAGNETE